MTIQNGLGIKGYSRTMERGIEGAPAEGRLPFARPMVNPLRKKVVELTVGGTAADGLYTVTITEPDGTVHDIEFDRQSSETSDGVSDGILAAVLLAIPLALAGVVEAAVDSDTNDVRLTFAHEGIDYLVAGDAPVGATLVPTTITTPEGSSVPFGRFVVDGGESRSGRAMALPDGSAETDIIGILLRPFGGSVNQEAALSSATDDLQPSDNGDVAREGAVYMRNVGADATENGAVHVVVNTAGGNTFGQARGDDDGANSVTLPARNAYWTEDTASGAIGPVFVRL